MTSDRCTDKPCRECRHHTVSWCETLDELTQTKADLAEAIEALRPFADRAVRYEPDEDDDNEPDWSTAAPLIKIGDLRRAAVIVKAAGRLLDGVEHNGNPRAALEE